MKTNRYKLLGTAGTWFILDIVFYANGLFSGEVAGALGGIRSPKGEAVSALILQSIALPGYVFSISYCNYIGRAIVLLYFDLSLSLHP